MNNQISFQTGLLPIFFRRKEDVRKIFWKKVNEKGKNYLKLRLEQGLGLLNLPLYLLVQEDNSEIVNQIKNGAANNGFFSTSLANLNCITFQEDYALLVKDNNQLIKITQTEAFKPSQITFKVISQKKIKPPRWGLNDYFHILEIEPCPLIEGLLPVTHLYFQFSDKSLNKEKKPLTKSKFYNSSILTETAGKTFAMGVKELNFNLLENKKNQLSFLSDFEFDWDSFQEIKKENTKNNSNNLQTVLIVGGIVSGLILVAALVFYYYRKKNPLTRKNK